MKKRAYQIYTIIVVGFAWLFLVHIGCCLADTPSRVVILPFKINAAKEFTFLREGLRDILTARLAWQEKVIVVDKYRTQEALKGFTDDIDGKSARSVGEKLGANYVLFGSLTIVGNSISLDARLVDIQNHKPPVTISNHSQGLDTVIPTIDKFATEINQKIFGRGVGTSKESFPLQTLATSDIYTHPERLLEDDQLAAGVKEGTSVRP